jgi:tetratricopeptide (TPR) repeat protein
MRRKNNVLIYLMLMMLVSGIFCGEVKAQTPVKDCGNLNGDAAIVTCNEAIRLNPQDAVAYNNRGVLWGNKGDTDRAIADLNEAIRLNPKYDKAYLERCVTWSQKGDRDRAIYDCNEAIRLNPQYALAYYIRAICWEFKNELAQALTDYRNFARLNPNDPDGLRSIQRIENKIDAKKVR